MKLRGILLLPCLVPALCSGIVLTRAAEDPPPPAAPAAEALADAREAGGLTLEDCYTIALANVERIGIAREDVVAAEQVRRDALSRILPQIDLEGYWYQQNSVDLPGVVCGSDQGVSFCDNRSEALIHLSQPLWAGRREFNFLRSTDELLAAARYGEEDARRRLYGAVATAFYDVLQTEAQVGTLEDSVALDKRRLEEVEARRAVGISRKTEVLLVQAQLAGEESALIRARNEGRLARERLSLLLTGPVDDLPLRDTLELPANALEGPEVDPAQEETFVATAMASRGDILQSAREVAAADRIVRVARGAWSPTLDLDAEWILGREHYSVFAQETDWTAEVNLTFNVFNGGRTRAGVAAAESRLRREELEHSELIRVMRLEVREAWLTLRSDASVLRTIETRVASAEENVSLLQEEFRNGLATNLEVTAAQNQLLSGRLDQDRQRHQVKVDWLALLVAQGLLPAPAAGAAP